jgi:hypothetical protein
VTVESVAEVETMVMENRQVSMDEITEILNVSQRSAHHVTHVVLQFHKVSTRQLTPEMKRLVGACEELLWCFEAEGDGSLSRTITGEET